MDDPARPPRHARDHALLRGAGGSAFTPPEGYIGVPETYERFLRDFYHLDEPWLVEFGHYVKNVVTLDFGPSLVQRNLTVDDVVEGAAPITLQLVLLAAAWSIPLGIATGLVAAVNRNGLVDRLLTSTATVLLVVPVFFVAYVTGRYVAREWHIVELGWDSWETRVAASLVLALAPIGYVARLVRAAVVDSGRVVVLRRGGEDERHAGAAWRHRRARDLRDRREHDRRHRVGAARSASAGAPVSRIRALTSNRASLSRCWFWRCSRPTASPGRRSTPHDANGVDLDRSRQGPSWAHPLGTDQLGRDLLARLAAGGRTTFLIAGGALAVILAIDTLYGTLAGLAGGSVDDALMRLVDGLLAIPRLPIAIVILVVLSVHAQTIAAMAFALSIASWMLTARLVRGEVRALKQKQFVVAARASGASWTRIARRHVFPNTAGAILISVFLELPAVILGEAFLLVLGLGPNPPTATWGNIAQGGLQFFRLWEMLLATAAITVFVLSANVIADGLHDALDPRRAE